MNSAIVKCILLLCTFSAAAQDRYIGSTDLNNVKNDQLYVEIEVPFIAEQNALFVFPKVVPGTYDMSGFGRFVEKFRAYNEKGRRLKARKIDPHAWQIKRSNKLSKVAYRINDTWDSEKPNFIFQPGGTHFKAGDEFVLNTFGVFGYVDGYLRDYPYELNIMHPDGMYGATSLDRREHGGKGDVFSAENYVELADQPILYAVPDTLTYMEGNAKIGIAVYSPTDQINAGVIADMVRPITNAASYVLGNIPTDEYWFLLHFFNWTDPEFTIGNMGGFGALEHKKSSLYFVPTYLDGDSVDMERVESIITGFGAHEFLHILSPLNLHSEEIAYFDFYNTELSRHLWLYEGVTEYLSMKTLLLGNVIDIEAFTEDIEGKVRNSQRYNDTLSFTEMSSNIIQPRYNRQFGNVYQKGALIAMLLDIKLAELTGGETDLIDLVLDLIRDYGISRPFRDEDLFDIITDRSHPDVREFFARHVERGDPLPLETTLEMCGLQYVVETGEDAISFGEFDMDYDVEAGLLIISPESGNDIIPGDLSISKLNGESLSFRLVRNLLTRPENDAPLTLTHVVDGAEQELTLVPDIGEGRPTYKIRVSEEMSDSQQKLFGRLFVPPVQED